VVQQAVRDGGYCTREKPAPRLSERALAIREAALGAGHPETATTLKDLAALLDDRGELAQARQYYERALVIRQRVDGPDHPDGDSAELVVAPDALEAGGDTEFLD
jgi:hypothetical protein